MNLAVQRTNQTCWADSDIEKLLLNVGVSLFFVLGGALIDLVLPLLPSRYMGKRACLGPYAKHGIVKEDVRVPVWFFTSKVNPLESEVGSPETQWLTVYLLL